jgi:hypothetical protein
MKPELQKLYRQLGYQGPLSAPAGEPAPTATSLDAPMMFTASSPVVTGSSLLVQDDSADRLPLDLNGVTALEERLKETPEEILARARAAWDESLTEDELIQAIADAKAMLESPDTGMMAFTSFAEHARKSQRLPPEFTFDGMNLAEIPIDPGITKFETKRDVARWVIFGGPWVISQPFQPKAKFRWHHGHTSNFVYQMKDPASNADVEVALVSDFGTGEYQSAYIAKQFRTRNPVFDYVLHLGDVYYAGRQSEFDTNFKPFLDPILARSKVFTLNANHEMYSLGKPYFAYIDERKRKSALQEQEGSYFCLRSGKFQIVAIDTAYFGQGRHREDALQHWLARVLREGRAQNRINILLSSDHAYDYGSTDLASLLDKDLRNVVITEKLVDLWFWGNVHYGALYDRNDALPFIGSCIGHGGYPYTRKRFGAPTPAEVRFLETAARFPEWTGLRQDRGNNGYCAMSLRHDGSIGLRYVDWMSHERCITRLAPDGAGVLRIVSNDPF